MRRIDFIVNPISGTRSKSDIPGLISKVFPKTDFDARIHITAYAGQGYEIAQEVLSLGTDTVVAVGGDGTINEIGRAMIGHPTAKFGIIPMGSGNGLANHIEIPTQVESALMLVREGHSEMIDYGDSNGHVFFTTSGTGFDADVGEQFSRMGTRGPITYGRAVLEKAVNYKPRNYILHLDDREIELEAFMVTVCNAAQWGNKIMVAPGASQQDGLFDVTVVKNFKVLAGAPLMAIQLLKGHLTSNENVETYKARHIRIESPELGYFHVDGEPIQLENGVEITMHPSGLRIIGPSKRINTL